MSEDRLEVWIRRQNGSEDSEPEPDFLAREEPLRLYLDELDLGIWMRTPGQDLDLARGHGLSEGYLTHPDEIDEIRLCRFSQVPGRGASATILRADPRKPLPKSSSRLVSGACGLCGADFVAALEAVQPLPEALRLGSQDLRLSPAQLLRALESCQDLFRATGGVHASVLLDTSGQVQAAAEDVGRHNALDKALGQAAGKGLWPPPPILVSSSRASFEMLLKAARSGIRAAYFVSSVSSLARDVARAGEIFLAGFLRPRGWVVVHDPKDQAAPGSRES